MRLPASPLHPLLAAAFLLVLLLAVPRGAAQEPGGSDPVFEKSIAELQEALAAGRLTSVQLVDAYLARVAAYDRHGPALTALLHLNPDARAEAARRDEERRAGNVRGPLHGIPVLLKDNYDTADMPTTGGSLALAGFVPPEDAFQVRRLREAGAILLGKTNMHELAAGITGVSSLGGQTRNPYDPTRSPGGSSSGSAAAVAASFAALAWGSDTCGSLRIPAAFHNLYALRPTRGLASSSGILPLSRTQDVGGPLARTVRDLALGLDATVGADPADPATRILEGREPPRFGEALDADALRGARLGLYTAYWNDEEDPPAARVLRAAVERLEALGAEVVEVEIPDLGELLGQAAVINYEFKYDLIDYLAARPGAPVASLDEILERSLHHAALEPRFRMRNELGTRDGEEYLAALARRDEARERIVRALDERRLDALVYPTVRRRPARIGEPQGGSTCTMSAVTGLPALSFPAGFTDDGLPVGLELLGRPLADARLVALAYAYEQAVQPRRPPRATPALAGGGAALRAARLEVTASVAGNAAVRAEFRFDYATNALEYEVRVTEPAAEEIYAITLDRSGETGRGPVLHRLSGPGAAEASGTLTLEGEALGEFLAGRLLLTVFTRAQPQGAVSAALPFR